MIYQPRVGRNFVAAHRNHRHGFSSAGEHDFGGAGHDALGSHGNRLQSGGAEAIDGHRRDLDRKTSAQGGDAGDIHSLFGFGHGAAEDNVFNFFGVKLRHAVKSGLDGDGGQFIGARGTERAFIRSAYGSTDGGNYYDFTHTVILTL